MCVATSGTSRSNFCEFELSLNSKQGTQSWATLVSKGLVDSLKWNWVITAKLSALSHVVPNFGALLKITSLGWGMNWSWTDKIPLMYRKPSDPHLLIVFLLYLFSHDHLLSNKLFVVLTFVFLEESWNQFG